MNESLRGNPHNPTRPNSGAKESGKCPKTQKPIKHYHNIEKVQKSNKLNNITITTKKNSSIFTPSVHYEGVRNCHKHQLAGAAIRAVLYERDTA